MLSIRNVVLPLLLSLAANGQQSASDSVFVFDLTTRQLTKFWVPIPDTIVNSGRTTYYKGTASTTVALPLSTPTSNLFQSTNFTDLIPASSLFDVTRYPCRTSVTFESYTDGTRTRNCTGAFVGSDFVVTAGHCLIGDTKQADSIIVLPAWDKGMVSGNFQRAKVQKLYFFKSYTVGGESDIVMAQLDQPLGAILGWIGLGYEESNVFYKSKNFHKFSYPGVVSPFDSTKVYNGDTMYYNYGWIEMLFGSTSNWIGVPSISAKAIPGMSGGHMIYTDNVEYHSFGIGVFSHYYGHLRFNKKIFFTFKYLLDNVSTGIAVFPPSKDGLIYPNPFSELGEIELPCVEYPTGNITFYDNTGKEVVFRHHYSGGRLVLYADNSPEGIYHAIIRCAELEKAIRFVVQR